MFTQKQAADICAKFQYLVGSSIDASMRLSMPIHAVVVSPYEHVAKQAFLSNLRQNKNASEALIRTTQPYTHYDVVLVHFFGFNSLDTDIRAYAKREGIEDQISEIPTES